MNVKNGGFLYLSELRIYGFKSFPDPVTIRFERGITGFVGPNGSGKSNIVDAIRWVLGEQSAKELRATLHEDLIFDGTNKRTASNLASVTVKFVNDDGELPLNFTEIEIERKIFKSGESQYLINKENVRLKDLVHLLTEMGLGTKTYSLFKKSLIEDIVNDKADALRNLLEESAGITIYKNSKKETLRKLIATQENLNRINDLIMEIEKNAKELKKQAGRTKRYFEMKTLYQNLTQDYYKKKNIKLEEELLKIEKIIEEKNERIKSFHEQIENIKKLIDEKRVEKSELEDQLEIKISEKENLQKNLFELKNNVSILSEKIDSLKIQIKDKKDFKEKITEEMPLKRERLKSDTEKFENLKRRIEKIENDRNSLGNNDVETLYRKSETEFDQLSSKIRKLDGEIVILNSKVNSLKTSIEYEEKILDEKRREFEEEKSKNELNLKELEKLNNEKVEITNEIEKIKKELNEIDNKRNELRGKERELYEKRDSLNKNIVVEKTRIEQIEERIRETKESFKDVLKVLEKDDIELLRNLVKPKEGYEQIVETALSLILNGVVLKKEDLEKLKGKRTPLVQIILKDLDYKRKEDENNLSNYIDGPDFIKDYFSNFKVVDKVDYDNLDMSGYIVTKDGFLVTPDKIFVKSGEVKVLNFVEEIENCQKRIKDFENDLERVSKEIDDVKGQIKDLNFNYDKKKNQLNELSGKERFVWESIKAFEKNIEAKRSYISKIEMKIKEVDEKKAKYVREIEENKERIVQVEKEKENLSVELKRVEYDFTKKREEFIVFKNRKDEIENIYMELLKEKESVEKDIKEVEIILNGYEKEINSFNSFFDEANNQIKKFEDEIDSKNEKILELEKSVETVDESIKELNEKVDEIETIIKEEEEKEEELRNLIEDITRENEENLLARERIVIEKKNNDEKIDPNFDIDYELISKYVETEEEEIRFLDEKIKNFGPVNELAFQEYTDTSARLEEILKQKEDVVQSKENLEKTIKTLDAKAKLLFSQYFDTIRVSFKELFSEIYKQGKADIILVDEENPLESDINIIFEPGEKKIGNLIKLSEGERGMMIVILLFAMYMVKPTPVCIMDEIDAPFDDATVENFTNLLRKFRERTQFIIITHNKRTMEFCDFLFGVTMEESGVTNVFSLNLQTISERFLKDATS
uniref:Chromosome partition protein Smc n=1 Tax=candidate division WOR-3 bacterium TaxID=2052148 RepID=A0A7C3J7F8_UNCW3